MKKVAIAILLLSVHAGTYAQNVGVNTDGSAPEAGVMLHVKGTNAVTAPGLQNVIQATSADASTAALKLRLGLYTNAAAASRYGLLDVYDATAGAYSNLALQPLGGNVGIGITSPSKHFHIYGAPEASLLEGYDITNTSVGNAMYLQSNTNAVYNGGVLLFGSTAGIGAYIKSGQVNGAQSRLYLGTYKATNVMSPDLTIDNSGYVGVGITAPAQKLDVQGGNARINNTFIGDVGHGASWAGFSHYSQNSTTGYALLSSNDGNYTLINKLNTGAGFIGFRVSNVDQMVILNNGNVGIGQTNPAAKLEVDGASGTTIKIVDGNQGAGKILTSDAAGSGSWQPMSGGGGGCSPSSQVFSSNGTFTVTAGTYVMVTICGGGGGGGGGGNGGTTQNASGGGGGGAESYFYYPLPVASTETWTITVGAGGTAGALNTNGGNGGASSIVGSTSGALMSVSGGSGGAKGAANSSNNGAYGGAGGNGGGGGAGVGGAGGAWDGAAWADAGSGGSVTASCNYSPGAGGGGGEFNNNYGSIAGTGGYVLPKTGGAPGNGSYYPGGGGGASLMGAGGAGAKNNGVAATAGSGNGAGGGGGGGNGPLNYGGTSSTGGAGSAGKVIIYYWQ